MCRVAWTRYLGVGKQRLERCKRAYHGIDERTISQGLMAAGYVSARGGAIMKHVGCKQWDLGETTRAAEQSASAHTFFTHLYYTAGESMPTK